VLADRIAGMTDRIDVLVNNAGGMANRLVVTPEGYEANFAGNHLGPFLLTHRLLPLLHAAAEDQPAGAVRVVVTASFASEMTQGLDFSTFVQPRDFNGGLSYTAGKLANVLFAKGLSERLAPSGIAVHAVAPGPVASNFFSHAPEDTLTNTRELVKATEAEGADTLIWLATAAEPGQSTGHYWFRRALRPANQLTEDKAYIDRFWAESEKLVGLA
jgi:NAD(P)-dependent dehydrogenase (short-subunit alcohol dehydrogenase family)